MSEETAAAEAVEETQAAETTTAEATAETTEVAEIFERIHTVSPARSSFG